MAASFDRKLTAIKNAIGSYPDFPKAGILFRDIFPIFQDVKLLEDLISIMAGIIETKAAGATVIAGLEARGFLFGPLIGLRLGLPFIPIRKAGKLPGAVVKTTYQLEYGSDSLEIQTNAISSHSKVVIVDDLMATGGTMEAACKLIETGGGNVTLCLAVIELLDLKGKEKLKAPFSSIVQY